MSLVTAADFPALFATPDESGLARGVELGLRGVGRRLEQDRLETAEKDRIKLMSAAQSAGEIRDMSGPGLEGKDRMAAYFKQRNAIATLASRAQQNGDGDVAEYWAKILEAETPDELNVKLSKLAADGLSASRKIGDVLAKRALAQTPGTGGVKYGNINPGDYTPDSMERFVAAGGGMENIGLLERYAAPQVVDIGGVPHLVSRSGDGQLSATPMALGTIDDEASGAAAIAGAESAASTEAQLKAEMGEGGAPSKAEVEASVTTARAEATADAKEKETQKQNLKAFNTYKVARENLAKVLSETTTGFLSGRLPAVSASQQVADSAQNILFPAVKALVRESGEGVFTDRDAEDIRRMLPGRTTSPEALPMVMWLIDSFIATKLGQPVPPQPKQGEPQDGLTPEEEAELQQLLQEKEQGLF